MQTVDNIIGLQATLTATVNAFYYHVGEINPEKDFHYYAKYKDGKMCVLLVFTDYYTEPKYENDLPESHYDIQEIYFSENTKISKAVNDITSEIERIHDAENPDLKYKHELI